MSARVVVAGVLRLGDGPYHEIPVRDNAADLIMLNDNHVANIPVPHGAGGFIHRRGAGQRHGVRASSVHEYAVSYNAPSFGAISLVVRQGEVDDKPLRRHSRASGNPGSTTKASGCQLPLA